MILSDTNKDIGINVDGHQIKNSSHEKLIRMYQIYVKRQVKNCMPLQE